MNPMSDSNSVLARRDLSRNAGPLSAVMPYVYAVRRNLSLVMMLMLLLVIGGASVITTIPNVYQAKTTILVDPQKVSDKYVTSISASGPSERLDTLTQQVLSTSRLEEVIQKEDLYRDMRRKAPLEDVVAFMRKKIKIELKQGSEQGMSSFAISYEDEDRSSVARTANELASSFIAWNLQVRQNQAAGTTQFLSTELDQAKRSLEQQEAQLEAFKLQHVGATPDQLDANLQAIARLQAQLQANVDTISRLDEERLLLSQTKASVETEQAPVTEADRLRQEKRQLENEVWSLRRQFTDTYPDVVLAKSQLEKVNQKLAAEGPAAATEPYDTGTRARLQIITKDLERHREEQASLQRQIAAYQGKVDTVPVLETQLTELTRNYEISRQNYQSLLDKRLSAGMSEDLERRQQAEHFVILDLARTPERPIRPNRLLLMGATVGLSGLISMAIVVAWSVVLGRIETEAQLQSLLPANIAILGAIPEISSAKDDRRRLLLRVQAVAVCLVVGVAVFVFLHRMRSL